MRVSVLGAAEAHLDSVEIPLGNRKQRAVLAALALHRGRPVHPDTVVDLVWGERPPAAVTATLQGYVARLRKALEPGRPARAPSQVLVTRDGGYALVLPRGALDLDRFEDAVAAAHARVAHVALLRPAGTSGTDPQLSYVDLDAALALWRGTPFAELDDAASAVAERARLEELRLVALEDRALVALSLGEHATVAAELEVLTGTHPLRERLWGLRALALTRSGRQADALDVLRRVRELLVDELGLEPGPELRELQTAVLRQDPALHWSPPPGTAAPSPPAAPGRTPSPTTTAEWSLVGRDQEVAALTALLDEARSGQTAFAVLTGEAGIGKSRLWAEVATAAGERGMPVLVGRCSGDEGAPPLYPWAAVLRELGDELPREDAPGTDAAAGFRAWEQIVRTVTDAARDRSMLLVLDDLHWADTSTLRVLRLLTESARSVGLLVLTTWRHEPPPTGALAEAAEMLARRHALRLHLEGLDAEQSADVVGAVIATAPTASEAAALRARTDGNPFFLVEFARLARDRGDLAGLLGEDDPPAAVSDVLTRRFAGLAEGTRRVLRLAAVLGRHFDVASLAVLAGVGEDAVLDALDPALAAGLVREDGVDHFRFAHALVRDTLYTGLGRSRRGRTHAEAAAVLGNVPGRETEVARHWLAAGPKHAAQAWRAAMTAAEQARRVFAFEESVELLRAAVAVQMQDPQVGPEDRYDVRASLAGSLQLSGNWLDMRTVCHELIELADELGDVDRLVEATTFTGTGSLWQANDHSTVDEVLVAAQRRLLETLPDGDSVARCQVMLSLATETYYGSSPAEREALSEEAVAMARRLADPVLVMSACLGAGIAIWRPATAARRLELWTEAAEVAERLHELSTQCAAMALRTVAHHELGHADELESGIPAARAVALQQRHLYCQAVLDGLELPYAAMRGEFDRVDALIADIARLGETLALPQFADALGGAMIMSQYWRGETAEMAEVAEAFDAASRLPTASFVAFAWCWVGRLDRARDVLARRDLRLELDEWYAPMNWALAAGAAAYLGDVSLAGTTYGLLAGLAGRPACAGSGTVLGPVDYFLGLAAVTTGEVAIARRHGDEAEALCERWRTPLALARVREGRRRFGF